MRSIRLANVRLTNSNRAHTILNLYILYARWTNESCRFRVTYDSYIYDDSARHTRYGNRVINHGRGNTGQD